MKNKLIRGFLASNFILINIILLLLSYQYLKGTFYNYNLISVVLSIIFLSIIIYRGEKSFWTIIGIMSYFRHAYFNWVVAYYIKNKISLYNTLPYVVPQDESYKRAAVIMIIEILSIIICYFYFNIIKPKENSNSNRQLKNKISVKNKYIYIFILLITFISTMFFYTPIASLINYASLILLYFELNYFIKNKIKEEPLKLFLAILLLIVVLSILATNNRKRLLYFGVAAYYFLKRMYPKKSKIIKNSVILSVLIGVFVLTISRFENTTLINYLINPSSITSYFLTIERVAIGVETAAFIPNSFGIQLLIDMFRPFIGFNLLFKNNDLLPSVDYFNQRISVGGLPRTDQIIPFNIQISFINLVSIPIVIFIITKIMTSLKEYENDELRYTFIIYYLLTVLSMFQVINITILINTITFNVLPVYIILETIKKINNQDKDLIRY